MFVLFILAVCVESWGSGQVRCSIRESDRTDCLMTFTTIVLPTTISYMYINSLHLIEKLFNIYKLLYMLNTYFIYFAIYILICIAILKYLPIYLIVMY